MQIHIILTTDSPPHLPLGQAPERGTWVYLATRQGDEILHLPYHRGLADALHEGRLFRYKEDALVCLYGRHYSTLEQ